MLPGLNERGFDVVAPSLPGYGFSAYPEKAGFKIEHVAGVMRGLMRRLGYARFVVQGGDWGSWVGRAMALMFPGEVVGVHLNMVGSSNIVVGFLLVGYDFLRSLKCLGLFDEVKN